MIKICEVDGSDLRQGIANALIAVDQDGLQYSDPMQLLTDLDDRFYFMALTGIARRAVLGDHDPGVGYLFALADEHDPGEANRIVLIFEA